jgi:hypothetical protein
MTVYTAVAPTPVALSGLAPTAASVFDVEAPAPVQFYGLPGVARTAGDVPPSVPTTSPDATSARVLDSAGTFIANLPNAKGLRWLDEHNTPGAGSIDYRRYDSVEALHSNLWSAGNQVMIAVGVNDIFRLVLDAQGGYRIDTVTGDRVDSWAGDGAMGVFNAGMCIPEYGWRPEATDERSFDYGSNPAIGGWLVGSEWKTPVGKPVRSSWRWTYKKRHLPKKWPEKKSEWLWYRNPDATHTSNETCYFRSSFTLASPARVKFWVCGDDTLEFKVDGEIRATTGPGGWKRPTKVVMWLSAGVHYVAAKVTNNPGSTGNQNRSGFLCAIGKINGDGDVVEWLRRTHPSTWTVRRQLDGAPGWMSGQILRELVQEQKDRGIAGHGPVTFGFTATTDSAGVPWTARQEMAITIGTLGLDYVQRLVETGIDVAMTPDLVLHAWRTRGADRSGWIRLNQGKKRRLDESASQLPGIRNDAHARANSGWVGQEHAASIAAHGRRETMITLGSSRSPEQTAAAVASMLPDMAEPPQTIEMEISSTTGPQPYQHFWTSDWVSARPAGWTTEGRFRVMAIAGEGTDLGPPKWKITLYEDAA